MGAMASQSPASRLFTQSFILARIKESIKAPRHWPLWGEFTTWGILCSTLPWNRPQPASNSQANAQEDEWYHSMKYWTVIFTTLNGLIMFCIQSLDQMWFHYTWWRHQMETFSALLAICAGNSPVTGEFPSQRPGTLISFICALNKLLAKQS